MSKKDEALKLALEALELHGQQYPHMVKCYCLDAITALREALAEQPVQQEPVAYIRKDQLQKAAQSPMLCEVTPEPRQDRIGIHTSPQPSKPWVGLTEQEILEAWCIHLDEGDEDEIEEWRHVINEAREIEAKLREKNA